MTPDVSAVAAKIEPPTASTMAAAPAAEERVEGLR